MKPKKAEIAVHGCQQSGSLFFIFFNILYIKTLNIRKFTGVCPLHNSNTFIFPDFVPVQNLIWACATLEDTIVKQFTSLLGIEIRTFEIGYNFFTKLTKWFKILSRLRKQKLQIKIQKIFLHKVFCFRKTVLLENSYSRMDGGDLESYSIIGQQNSRIPATHLYRNS